MLTLNGTGMLRVSGKDAGKVQYQIILEQRGTIETATGSLSMPGSLVLSDRPLRDVTLVSDSDGFEMALLVKTLSPDGRARIEVVGAVGAGL